MPRWDDLTCKKEVYVPNLKGNTGSTGSALSAMIVLQWPVEIDKQLLQPNKRSSLINKTKHACKKPTATF